MDQKLLHILIVWSKGYDKLDEIVKDLSNSFSVLNVFEFTWEKKAFHENLKRFYAHSQMDKTPQEFDAIVSNKIKLCGDGPFTVVVFEDPNPVLETRKTSNGENLVNTNVFDLKTKFRKLTGGGHKIHASDNYFETNKDLTLLFGKNTDDYHNLYKPSKSIIKKDDNIVGVPNWQSISQLFFVLNNCLNYVVLRNFEPLPDSYFVNSHGDIDLLVENYNYVKYLTGAIEKFPDKAYRVYNYIQINDEKVPFDFRYVGDGYYDKKWEQNILDTKAYNPKGFYVPNPTNYFYSLLYHAYIQKESVSADYKVRLSKMASQLNIPYNENVALEAAIGIITKFMQANVYQFSVPKDETVYFNKKNIDLNHVKALGGHLLINSSISRTSTKSFLSEVYDGGDKIIKIASKPINENEYKFLKKIEKYRFSPKALTFNSFENYDKVEMEKIVHFPLEETLNKVKFWDKDNITSIVECSIKILTHLLEANILHRDIRPNNLLLAKEEDIYTLKLIDYGWAIDIGQKDEAMTPFRLGSNFKHPHKGFSDAYAMGRFLLHVFGNLSVTKNVIRELSNIAPDDYNDTEKLSNTLKEILKGFNVNISKKSFRKELLYWKLKALVGRKTIRRFRKVFKN